MLLVACIVLCHQHQVPYPEALEALFCVNSHLIMLPVKEEANGLHGHILKLADIFLLYTPTFYCCVRHNRNRSLTCGIISFWLKMKTLQTH